MKTKYIVLEPVDRIDQAVKNLAKEIEWRKRLKVISSGITPEPINERKCLYIPWAIYTTI